MKLFQSGTICQQRNNHEIFRDLNFCTKMFRTPNSKSTVATLYVATIEKPELTIRLISTLSLRELEEVLLDVEQCLNTIRLMHNKDDVVCPVSILNALVFGQQNLVAAEDESKNINCKTMRKRQNYVVQGNSIEKTVTRIFEIPQKKAFCK